MASIPMMHQDIEMLRESMQELTKLRELDISFTELGRPARGRLLLHVS